MYKRADLLFLKIGKKTETDFFDPADPRESSGCINITTGEREPEHRKHGGC